MPHIHVLWPARSWRMTPRKGLGIEALQALLGSVIKASVQRHFACVELPEIPAGVIEVIHHERNMMDDRGDELNGYNLVWIYIDLDFQPSRQAKLLESVVAFNLDVAECLAENGFHHVTWPRQFQTLSSPPTIHGGGFRSAIVSLHIGGLVTLQVGSDVFREYPAPPRSKTISLVALGCDRLSVHPDAEVLLTLGAIGQRPRGIVRGTPAEWDEWLAKHNQPTLFSCSNAGHVLQELEMAGFWKIERFDGGEPNVYTWRDLVTYGLVDARK